MRSALRLPLKSFASSAGVLMGRTHSIVLVGPRAGPAAAQQRGSVMKLSALAAALGLAASGAHAQSAPRPDCAGAPYDQFDFWIGEWDVFTPDGKKAGDNVIAPEEGGCVLVERWADMRSGTGQSYNFYDPGLGKWRQVWVSRGATIDYAGGLDASGAMVLEGEIAYRNGTTAAFKGTWTLEDDGTVTQYFQQFDDAKKKWTDWFKGTYRRKAE